MHHRLYLRSNIDYTYIQNGEITFSGDTGTFIALGSTNEIAPGIQGNLSSDDINKILVYGVNGEKIPVTEASVSGKTLTLIAPTANNATADVLIPIKSENTTQRTKTKIDGITSSISAVENTRLVNGQMLIEIPNKISGDT